MWLSYRYFQTHEHLSPASILLFFALISCFSISLLLPATAQEIGYVEGTVLVSDSGILQRAVGATVILIPLPSEMGGPLNQRGEIGAAADTAGRYTISAPVGAYLIKAYFVGFVSPQDTVDINPEETVIRNLNS